MIYDIIIIGAGTAGLTCALYAKRSGLNVVVLEKYVPGGQIINTPYVDNYPAVEKISGVTFATNLMNQVKKLDVNIIYDSVLNFDFSSNIKSITTKNDTFTSKTIVIANGVNRRELECDGEQKFKGRGVSYCGTCDGAFFKDKVVCVVGGGNTAVEDALLLSNLCKKVYLIHRRDTFRASEILVKALAKRDNIEILFNSTIDEITGNKNVTSIFVNTENSVYEYEVDGVFVAIGLKSNNEIFSDIINLDKSGYIIADETLKTNLSGVFVAGDTRTKALRQLVTAASDGAISAMACANYITENLQDN